MNLDIDHVFLTRFNLPTKGAESLLRAQEGWLKERVELFERYCLPSMLDQDSKHFSWIVYFDPSSPQWLKEKISRWTSTGTFRAIYREEVSREELKSDLRLITGAEGQALLTTNLDNDDGLASDFVSRLQESCLAGERKGIYLSYGLILKGTQLYLNRDDENAFCSVLESWVDPVTCWVDWHNRLADHMSIQRVYGLPAWVQIIHGRNVSNRVHGKRVAPHNYTEIFGELIAEANTPRRYELLLETCWQQPRRYVYELGRRTAKETVLRLGGKVGLDKIKNLVQRVRNIA